MNASLTRILRSPLLHFALAGALLFALASALDLGGLGAWRRSLFAGGSGPSAGLRADGAGAEGGACTPDADPATICVERDALLAFIQSQTRMARVEEASSAFEGATEAVRRDWIERFVREEALVREARALGLDRDDELVRRRLVQQMEFLAEETGASAPTVTDAEIEAAYRARAREFRHPAIFRFAHVFTREFEGYEDKAPARAKAILDEMNRKKVPFEEGYPYGDRFPYDRTYVDRTLDEIRSHFGDAFAKTLTKLEPNPGSWTGPHRSEHGLHLLLLVDKQPARDSSLEEVRDALREELLREKRDRAVEQAVAAIVAKYRVSLGGGVASREAARVAP
ncbi:MAG: peptidyl-prolyl cis-trans isomerase [Deltaproteobacteria bacterium]|nr:peptidyl-prolyl cis-trans isomerase [Deltaproteobacteria bacterium]